MTKAIHVTRDGEMMPISKMTDQHLSNMISYLRRRAAMGIKFDDDDPRSRSILYGPDALRVTNFDLYVKEQKRREQKRKREEQKRKREEKVLDDSRKIDI